MKNKFSFINAWGPSNKQWDKHAVKVRFGKITILDFYLDWNRRQWGFMFMNFGIRKNKTL